MHRLLALGLAVLVTCAAGCGRNDPLVITQHPVAGYLPLTDIGPERSTLTNLAEAEVVLRVPDEMMDRLAGMAGQRRTPDQIAVVVSAWSAHDFTPVLRGVQEEQMGGRGYSIRVHDVGATETPDGVFGTMAVRVDLATQAYEFRCAAVLRRQGRTAEGIDRLACQTTWIGPVRVHHMEPT